MAGTINALRILTICEQLITNTLAYAEKLRHEDASLA
ncbi:MAG: hypothetical protein ACJA2S_003664, partial [Cyclobacteriaceae bacterium]